MSTNDKPTVLIVGAGLGGLMLGALLEKSGVPYRIFERATTVKPLGTWLMGIYNSVLNAELSFTLLITISRQIGSAMSIGPTLLPIFQQMGIYDDILAAGKYMTHTESFKETLEPYKPQDYRPIEDL
jgi:2-polyprenyl-6-methoxyphenol hydroxylase-like FAD-dependent oxidoreductase